MRSIGQILRGIISFRHHYIMKISFDDSIEAEQNSDISLVKVNDDSELVPGTYSVNLQKRIIDANPGKCDTYILKDCETKSSIGILSVMYKGGDELEYKIRDIDAFIYNVKIDENHRGKGYAGRMIAMLGECLRAKNINEAYLSVSTDNISAIKAYKKSGFEIVAEKKFIRTMKKNIPYYSL